MTERELMELAISEAEKCNWPERERDRNPNVGAVIAIDGDPIAQAHRGKEDHAEKRALENISRGRDLTNAIEGIWGPIVGAATLMIRAAVASRYPLFVGVVPRHRVARRPPDTDRGIGVICDREGGVSWRGRVRHGEVAA